MTPECLATSSGVTLRLTNRTSGSWNAVFDAVVKSLYLVPMPTTTSASLASALATGEPVEPTPPPASGGPATAHGLGVVPENRALAGLRVGDRNPRGLDEPA